MFPEVPEARPGVFLLGFLSTVVLMTTYAIFAVIVIIGSTLASVALLNHVPDNALAKGAAIACTALLGVYAFPVFVEQWEEAFIAWSWKNGL